AADIPMFAVGFVTAFVVALIAIKTFLQLIKRISFIPFAIYRFGDNTGVIVFKGTDPDHIFEILLDAEVDVRDVTEEEGNIVIYTE
ncbi:hypothetical protein MJN85_28905, partial [Salmonella enterica subsp. enterica serovar Anatum]|nr:hypothetical protein [Salmonella enterica subsp. enterica serovar Anatum]